MLRNELLKYRRSRVAVVLLLVPLISVVFGAGNYAANREQLRHGWQSYLSQATLLYSLLFMAVGIAIIGSAAWRFEHRGNNWNQLMTVPHRRVTVFLAKTGAMVVLLGLMQAVLVVLAIVAGLLLRIPGQLPLPALLPMFVAVLPGAAVAAWQSLLSMVLRSFTLPVVFASIGSIVGFGIIASGAPQSLGFVVAPSMLTSVFSMGSTALATAQPLSVSVVMPYIAASVLSVATATLTAAGVLRFTDVRA